MRRSCFKSLMLVLLLVLFLWAAIAPAPGVEAGWPANLPGSWNPVGRLVMQTNSDSVTIDNGYVVTGQSWSDAEITFRARAPLGTEQVQIWGGFRCHDRDRRYVFALRGGHDNDLYLARYAPDGGAEFLGFAPLDFKPEPGVWYRLRVVAMGDRIQIFLNDEKLPRINVRDRESAWTDGGAALGGGWLPAEFTDFQARPLTTEERAAFSALGNQRWSPPPVDKEAQRRNQRAAYVPATVPAFTNVRTEVSLDGDWLFLPDYQLRAGETPVSLDYDDQKWHVMPVPSFWTPGLSWLHGETSFPDLDKYSQTKGVAESLYVQEIQRCDAYTFDWHKTAAAWYRHYLDLPADLGGRHFELSFAAVAKISEVWVNGTKVGSHTGMFGPARYDLTPRLKPGRNVIAVHAASQLPSASESPGKVEGVAVTVEVTSAMLHSLPHGMFQDDVGGIWQPVKLTATAPVRVDDAFIEPGLHGADISLDVLNGGGEPTLVPVKVTVSYRITAAGDGSLLYANTLTQPFTALPGVTNQWKWSTPYLNPKLWSPQHPNLYNLEVQLNVGGQTVDRYQVRFGFRTFAVSGNQFLLNGQPYWLRGANPFPNTLRPNDGVLARRFMEIARAGNIRVTRSHIVPFTSTWLDAADEAGMAVSFEGTWPWLMLRGEPPDDDLIKTWRDEFISLIRENRNHPSIILWTVNNEMKFEQADQNDPELLKRKWSILNDTIKAMRAADPTRPVVADSSYVRKEAMKGYQTLVHPDKLDDGDVDDTHRYFGWYNDSFFHLYEGEFNRSSTPGRPLISQEMSTGYPNNDDGHPARFYLFKHYTPQALVGDDAYENADPAIFLERQAFMTKELAETLRRTSHDAGAGVLFFSYFTWFQTPWSADQIRSWPTYDAIKTALQPVLVSAELYGRHFYSGRTLRRRVCIINDTEDGQALPATELVWEFRQAGQVLSRGRVSVPAVAYYANQWFNVDFTTPQDLPAPRVDGQLVLRLEADGKTLSENSYDVVLATAAWADGAAREQNRYQLWNPSGHPVASLAGVPVTTVRSPATADPESLLIVGDWGGHTMTADQANQLRKFISNGGNVLMLHPGAAVKTLFPEQIRSFQAKAGEIVTLHVPESPVFAGIEPLDIAWFDRGRNLPIACTGVYHLAPGHADITVLAEQCDIHGYLKVTSDIAKYSGAPLVEIRLGQGRLLASELNFESGPADPIARRLLSNALDYLSRR